MSIEELKRSFLGHLVIRCGDYRGLYEAVKRHDSIFRLYGITTSIEYGGEINFDTEETMMCVVRCLEDMMGTDEGIHFGYNDTEQGEIGEDGGKYYLFVDLGAKAGDWWK